MRIALDQDRTNRLSLVPGGVEIITVDIHLNYVLYDKVKDFQEYLFETFKNKKIMGAFVGTDRIYHANPKI